MIAIVTDSTAYFSRKEADALGISIVPVNYGLGAPSKKEGFVNENAGFAQLLEEEPGQCRTAHSSTEDFKLVFQPLLKQGLEILCLTLSSRLSGTFGCAAMAAQALSPEKIMVVDSLSTGGGLALLAKRAAAMAKKGLPLKELAAAIEKLREKIGVAFSVEEMEPLRKSGRILAVPQSARTILNHRPILLCNEGAVVYAGLARGRNRQIKDLVGSIPDCASEALIHYIQDESSAAMLLESVREKLPHIRTSLSPLGPVLGIHLGAGVIGVAWICD